MLEESLMGCRWTVCQSARIIMRAAELRPLRREAGTEVQNPTSGMRLHSAINARFAGGCSKLSAGSCHGSYRPHN